jgi:hypothetical protein
VSRTYDNTSAPFDYHNPFLPGRAPYDYNLGTAANDPDRSDHISFHSPIEVGQISLIKAAS